MKILLSLSLSVVVMSIAMSGFAQNPIHMELKKQLDTILLTDQGIREFGDTETTDKRKDTLALLLNYPRAELNKNAYAISRKIDSVNLEKVERIIKEYGYPGKTMVGEPANTAVFYVIQHSGKISTYYPLIEKAGKSGELPLKYMAMMLDRKLGQEGKPQLYGTQVYMQMVLNPKTGKKEPFEYVVPIEDAKNVNKRRKEAGFDNTVEENALRFGIVYKEYTLEQINKIVKP